MTRPSKSAAPEVTPAVTSGTILANGQGDLTTVWRNGEVWREDRWGRAKRLPDIDPIREGRAR